jgi:hypothetical protein
LRQSQRGDIRSHGGGYTLSCLLVMQKEPFLEMVGGIAMPFAVADNNDAAVWRC